MLVLIYLYISLEIRHYQTISACTGGNFLGIYKISSILFATLTSQTFCCSALACNEIDINLINNDINHNITIRPNYFSLH